ncbi:MAG TPA: hypothetical protein VJM81_02230 [Rhizorhapis sp.]|nr:hypothetical protein [Rhizorhapis sp.]
MMMSPVKRDPHARLLRLLLAMAGEGAEILSSSGRPWSSATFSGARHKTVLKISGGDAHVRAQQFAAKVPEAEFRLPGHIVADAVVEAWTWESGKATMELALLTVEDW